MIETRSVIGCYLSSNQMDAPELSTVAGVCMKPGAIHLIRPPNCKCNEAIGMQPDWVERFYPSCDFEFVPSHITSIGSSLNSVAVEATKDTWIKKQLLTIEAIETLPFQTLTCNARRLSKVAGRPIAGTHPQDCVAPESVSSKVLLFGMPVSNPTWEEPNICVPPIFDFVREQRDRKEDRTLWHRVLQSICILFSCNGYQMTISGSVRDYCVDGTGDYSGFVVGHGLREQGSGRTKSCHTETKIKD
ncbi:uncharacterized protein CIMG_12103 [Coccidioides immitis RS]|uniref:Uncharacterized protein n=1 Tax=Coccidioides immitis (strain RS) TaxID=246410 RepID=A0A0D8JV68_COCIM|nr:uncharacterized protein CIMG_12103 [Coccidioides immitis RS]KJF60826.1 hypothetical protein CIMG_12103 [Coccidioides immitis RS]